MNNLVRILVYGLFSDGKSIGDWNIDTLHEKINKYSNDFTYSEKHALVFLEECGDYMGERETWKKPYGDVLNEKRKLH